MVDDVRFTRISLLRMLQRLGYAPVYEAEDGAAALHVLEREAVDCVISDLDMPGINGLELLKAIRSGTASISRAIPVVLIAGHPELEHLGPAMLLDLDGFLAKPLSQEAVASCLAEVFGEKPRHNIAAASVYAQVDLSPSLAEQSAQVLGEEAAGREAPLSAVPENSVLARDLLYANGRLLLRAGTKLSPLILGRLRDMAALTGLAETVWIVE